MHFPGEDAWFYRGACPAAEANPTSKYHRHCMSVFSGVLIANRGEIAVRIAITLARMNIRSVGVFHQEDRNSPLLELVDEAVEIFGPTPVAAYMDYQSLLTICKEHRVDAIHPGYGFLAENPDFAQAVENAGLRLIGPSSRVIRLMGNKEQAREFAAEQGIPIAPSVYDHGDGFFERIGALGFPLLVKAVAGGGGKGMRIVRSEEELETALETARSEGQRYFGSGRLYCERYIEQPRHIEVQILADSQGNCVHLGERDCSVQRRFQKIVEESPAPGIPAGLREEIRRAAVILAQAAGYTSAGTVEFLLDPEGGFYFLEMNTRLQVEHPVTEMITGLDLVEEQIRIAAGESLRVAQEELVFTGHALECRICAEIPEQGHAPATGTIALLVAPRGPGIRFDCGVTQGQEVTASFDPLLAKLVVHGKDRAQALDRMIQALRSLVLLGVPVNAHYLERVIDHPQFRQGTVHTRFLEDLEENLLEGELSREEIVQLLALSALADRQVRGAADAVPEPYAAMGAWRN